MLNQSDMVGTMPVTGSYLEIKAFKMELKVIEKHFQAEHGAYSPTASHTLDTHTQQQCCCFSACFPQDSCKYILEVQPCPLSDECGHLLWAVPPLSGLLRLTVTELSPTAKCIDIPLTLSSTLDAQGVLHLLDVSVIVCSLVTSVAWLLVIWLSKISFDPDSLSCLLSE